MKSYRYLGLAAATAALVTMAAPASAEVFWSNFTPGTDINRTTGGQFPTVDRAPATPHDNGGVSVGINGTISWFSVYFEFVVDSTFRANNAIVAMQNQTAPFSQRIGFSFSHFNTDTGEWEAMQSELENPIHGSGYFQIQANGLPFNRVAEVDSAFGNNYTNRPELYHFAPLDFVAGEKYAVRAVHWAGGIGMQQWLFSDVTAAPGTATAGQRYDRDSRGNLAFQPTLALTDGENPFIAGGVPEPATWAMMIFGFGLAGAALRRRRTVQARSLRISFQ